MTIRICKSCGEPLAKGGNASFRNLNICNTCSCLPEEEELCGPDGGCLSRGNSRVSQLENGSPAEESNFAAAETTARPPLEATLLRSIKTSSSQ